MKMLRSDRVKNIVCFTLLWFESVGKPSSA